MAINTSPTFYSAGVGVSTTNLASLDVGRSMFIQSDGKILVAGSFNIYGYNEFILLRYNNNGLLDTSFGDQGVLRAPVPTLAIASAYSVIQQADGKIIATGVSGNNQTLVIRFNADGSLDTNFDGDGNLVGFNGDSVRNGFATIHSDGKILLAGVDNTSKVILQLLNEDGTANTAFGVNGQIITNITADTSSISISGNPISVITQTDGKIVLLGSAGPSGFTGGYVVARYNSDGTLDTSFNGTGYTTSAISPLLFSSHQDKGTGLAIQSDGKIVVAGYSLMSGTGGLKGAGYNSGQYDFTLTRYNSDGSLDTSFSSDGKAIISVSAGADLSSTVTIQTDGKILLTGYSSDPTKNGANFTLIRFNTDGTLDTSFSGDGILTHSITNLTDQAFNVRVQDDGKIVIAGNAGYDYNNSNFALVRFNSNGTIDTTFAPVNTLNNTPNYVENAPPAALDSNVQIYDAELSALNGGNGNYNGASVTLARQGGANAQDVFSGSGNLSFSGGSAVLSGVNIGSVTNANGSLVITFNGNASQARINEALSSIAYSNISDTPPASVQIKWTFNDANLGAQGSGGGLNAFGSIAVSINATNDVPVLNIPIPDQNAVTGASLNHNLPNNIFTDIGGDTLNYSATLSNGDPLPDWLTFDEATRTFSGIPPQAGSFVLTFVSQLQIHFWQAHRMFSRLILTLLR